MHNVIIGILYYVLPGYDIYDYNGILCDLWLNVCQVLEGIHDIQESINEWQSECSYHIYNFNFEYWSLNTCDEIMLKVWYLFTSTRFDPITDELLF